MPRTCVSRLAGSLLLIGLLAQPAFAQQPGYGAPISLDLAERAATLRRPSKALEDGIAGGRNALLSLPDLLMIEGAMSAGGPARCASG